MAENIEEVGIDKIDGCLDSIASNFNPVADSWCQDYVFGAQPQPDLGGVYTNGCCQYNVSALTGCMDPQANNYETYYIFPCSNCCDYGSGSGGDGGIEQSPNDFVTDPIEFNPGGGGDGEVNETINCEDLFYSVNSQTNEVLSGGESIQEDCCNELYNGFPVTWNDGSKQCFKLTEISDSNLCEGVNSGEISQAEFESRVICINCDNFAWWDNLYTTVNGFSLQEVDQDLWDYLVELITTNPEPGQTTFTSGSFYVDGITGEPIVGENCCNLLPSSNFTTVITDFGDEVSACLCNVEPELVENCECVSSLDLFLSIASTTSGSNLLLNTTFLTTLGLTLEQSTFVINNLFNPNSGNNIKARVYISNILYITGGFHVCYEQYTNSTSTNSLNTNYIQIGEQQCNDINQLNGFFDGGVCFCLPQEECTLSLTDISVISEVDSFNQEITYATFNGQDLDKECCLKIASEDNLSWSYETYDGVTRCFTKDPNPCLPLEFNLNKELIKPECNQPLDVSVSFYFGIPENPCVEIETDDEVIIVDGEDEPCLLEFDENNNLIDYNTPRVVTTRRLPDGNNIIISGDTINNGEPCCYNPNVPIEALLVIKNQNNEIIQTSEPISFNELETWFDVTTQVSITTGTTEFNVALQFISGLNCCCTYDIYLDNFKFSCSDEETTIDIIRNNCPGFNITPVIDNKKSWVYNPGVKNYSNIQNQAGTLTDNVIIKNGESGLIEGYGEINRRFAPSPDADLPWRYTDYWKQSSVLEKHSNLVLNSKELFLTFDMCNIGGPCPDGYTLSAGTETCYRETIGCPDGYTLSAGTTTCYSGETCDCLNIEWSLSGGTSGETLNTHFVTTVFGKRAWAFDVSGNTHTLEYRTSPNRWLIFNGFGLGSWSFPSVADCPTSTLTDWTDIGALPNLIFTGLTITEGVCSGTTTSATTVTLTQKSDPLACKTNLTLLDLEGYKKTFQNFWVQFVEQFVPATTIFVSGERWCNRPDEICAQYEECDFDFEFVEGDVTTIPNNSDTGFSPTPSNDSGDFVPNNGNVPITDTDEEIEPAIDETTEDGPINNRNFIVNPLPDEEGDVKKMISVVNDINTRMDRYNNYRERLQPTETIIE